MVRAAIIQDGLVANIVIAKDEANAQANGWIITDTAGIGWAYDGETFAAPEPPTPAPSQAQVALEAAGFTEAQIVAILAAVGQPS